MPIRPELRHTAREAMAEEYLDVSLRRPGGDPYGRAPPVRGTPSVSGILANGRVIPLHTREPLVPLGDLDQLVGTLRRMGEGGDAAIRARSQAVARLSRTVAADADRLARARGAARRKLAAQALAADAKLDRRLEKELISLREDIEKAGTRHALLVRRLARRALWNDLVVVSALPLFAAYGQRGNPFASNNLTLTLSLLVWLLGDELMDLISGRKPAFGVRDTDLWSYIAPVTNLLTGWFLLRNSQHERFVTGFADDFRASRSSGGALLDASTGEMTLDGGGPEREVQEHYFIFRQAIDLAPSIAPDYLDSFQIFEGVPAVASIAQIAWGPGLDDLANRRIVGITAAVEDGVLIITVTVVVAVPSSEEPPYPDKILSALSVAWIVDTAQPKD